MDTKPAILRAPSLDALRGPAILIMPLIALLGIYPLLNALGQYTFSAFLKGAVVTV